jgi:hypothetical protein
MMEMNSEKKILFLEAFTEELVKSSFKRVGLFRIQKLIEDREGFQDPQERRALVKKIVESKEKEREERVSSLHELSEPVGFTRSVSVYEKPVVKKAPPSFFNVFKPKTNPNVSNVQPVRKFAKVLRVPEPRLPSRLSYLTPVKTNEDINLGKLNPFVQDSNVISIEIEGPNKNVLVSGKMGTKKTGIVLTNEEIDKVLNDFSSNTKIPITNGVNKMAFGKLILNAIISDNMDKRLSLKKIFNNSVNIPKSTSDEKIITDHKRKVFST